MTEPNPQKPTEDAAPPAPPAPPVNTPTSAGAEAGTGKAAATAPKRRRGLEIPEGKVAVVTLLLTVKKKTSEVATVVPEHEFQILSAIHPDGDIKIIDDTHGVLFLDDDAEAELQRLSKKYDDKTTRYVAVAFPTIQHLAAAAGMGFQRGNLRRGPTGPAQSEQIDFQAKNNKSDAQLLRERLSGG